MEKINFTNNKTPLNDTNLNKMQDNMENAINEVAMKDTGWIDLSQYVNSYLVSIREGHPPMARKINNTVYLRGEVYISTESQTNQFNILESLPSSLIPSYQVTGGGTTYEDLRNYAIWTENGNITVYIENKSVQSEYKGFDLCNIAPYIVD
jgi:hypothetical protein